MSGMAESRQVHESVRHLDNALEVYLCKKCHNYHCPLCPTERVQFKAVHEAVGHLQNHLTWTVVNGCFKVYKCHLSCHDKPHYHCHSCHKCIVRRCDYTSHIKRHPSPAAKHPGSPEKRPASAVVPPSPSVGPPGPAVVPPNPSMGPPDPHPRSAPSGFVAAKGKIKVEHRPKFDVHESVRHLDNALEVYLCKKCPNYHCPLCPTERVQFKAVHEAVGHLQNHLTWTVVNGCFKVYKCHHNCHDKPHYHCQSCHKCIVRRCDYSSHIKRHHRPTAKSHILPEERPASAVVPSSLGPPGPPIGPPDPSVEPSASSDGPFGSPIGPPAPSVVPPGPSIGPPDLRPRPAVSHLVAARVKLKVLHCPKCDLRLYAKNPKTHLVRRHTATGVDVAYSNQPV